MCLCVVPVSLVHAGYICLCTLLTFIDRTVNTTQKTSLQCSQVTKLTYWMHLVCVCVWWFVRLFINCSAHVKWLKNFIAWFQINVQLLLLEEDCLQTEIHTATFLSFDIFTLIFLIIKMIFYGIHLNLYYFGRCRDINKIRIEQNKLKGQSLKQNGVLTDPSENSPQRSLSLW